MKRVMTCNAHSGTITNLQLDVFQNQAIEYLLLQDTRGWLVAALFGDAFLYFTYTLIKLTLHDYIVIDDSYDAIQWLNVGLHQRGEQQGAQQ